MCTKYTNATFFIKGALKIACLFTNNASASDPLPGLRPWTGPLGDFGPPDLLLCAVRFSNYFRTRGLRLSGRRR